jgi:recombination protein RecT
MSNLAVRETKVMEAFEIEALQNQVRGLLGSNQRNIEAFKAKIIKLSLSDILKNCTPESVIGCGVQALTLDLPLEAGQGYVVAYKGKATLDVGYKGWQVLAKRAGYSVLSDVVYNCDEFSQSGFGFDREMVFNPSFSQRKGSDDKWAKNNLTGVIVSVMEDESGQKTQTFVDAAMINKIVGKSPSKDSGHSPHNNWAEQMFSAKAIKQVLSKFPIDLSRASQLQEAIEIVNTTESMAQQQAPQGLSEYPQERFTENFPKWRDLVESGAKKAMAIITQLSNSYTLTSTQLEDVMTLTNFEPINGEVAQEQE